MKIIIISSKDKRQVMIVEEMEGEEKIKQEGNRREIKKMRAITRKKDGKRKRRKLKDEEAEGNYHIEKDAKRKKREKLEGERKKEAST